MPWLHYIIDKYGSSSPFPNPWVATPNMVAKRFSCGHQNLNALQQVINNV